MHDFQPWSLVPVSVCDVMHSMMTVIMAGCDNINIYSPKADIWHIDGIFVPALQRVLQSITNLSRFHTEVLNVGDCTCTSLKPELLEHICSTETFG
jgi:hypothetical protein